MSNFALSPRSIERMAGIHPDLFRSCNAIQVTEVDFGVTQGLRTIEKAAAVCRRGKVAGR